MTDFLTNLARRGAGLAPLAPGGAPAALRRAPPPEPGAFDPGGLEEVSVEVTAPSPAGGAVRREPSPPPRPAPPADALPLRQATALDRPEPGLRPPPRAHDMAPPEHRRPEPPPLRETELRPAVEPAIRQEAGPASAPVARPSQAPGMLPTVPAATAEGQARPPDSVAMRVERLEIGTTVPAPPAAGVAAIGEPAPLPSAREAVRPSPAPRPAADAVTPLPLPPEVTVRIGRIDVRVAPPAAPPQRSPPAPRTRGFEAYARLRRHLDHP